MKNVRIQEWKNVDKEPNRCHEKLTDTFSEKSELLVFSTQIVIASYTFLVNIIVVRYNKYGKPNAKNT